MESYSLRNMYLAVFVVNIQYLYIGWVLVWTSPSLQLLKSSHPMTIPHEAAIISSCCLGMVFGPVIGQLLIERYGYKSVMWLNIGLSIVSVMFLSISSSVFCISVGRVCLGVAIGAIICHMPIYVVDIADPEVRDVFRPLTLPTQSLGYLLVYCLGPHIRYSLLLTIALVVPLFSLVSLPWLPESPQYQLTKGNTAQATKAVSFLQRGISTNAVNTRIIHIQEQIRQQQAEESDWLALMSTATNSRLLVLTAGLLCFQQLCGAPILLMVLQTLIAQTTPPKLVTISVTTIGIIIFIVTLVDPYLQNKFGLKKLLVVSALGMSSSMLFFGVYLSNKDTNIPHSSVVPPACILLYLTAFQLGFAKIGPDTIGGGSQLSPKFKCLAAITTLTIGFFVLFVISYIYFSLETTLGIPGVMGLFAVFCFLAAGFVACCIPDMSNMMTSTELQNFLSKESFFQIPWSNSAS